MLSSLKKNISILLFLPLLASCATSNEVYKDITMPVIAGDYVEALEVHEKKSPKLYSKNDALLHTLNSGMISHYAKDYELSNKRLSSAEDLIRGMYGISISNTVAGAVINDTITEYSGEDYEDVYTNAFKALNYVALENNEAARVEIRRLNIKLTELRLKYRDELNSARKDFNSLNIDLSNVDTSKAKIDLEFTESAFARYISLLLYRDERNLDASNVDYKFIQDAYKVQPKLYNFTMPSHIKEDITYPKTKARLNIIAFSGLSPLKEAEDMRLMLNDLYIKISLPVMVPRPSVVHSVEIRAIDKETQEVYTETLEKLESIENIVVDTYQQKQALIYVKNIVRSISKALITHTTTQQVGGTAQMLSPLAQLLLGELTENADIRLSQYFPANVYSTGITVDEGVYDITIQYKNKSGSNLYTNHIEDVQVYKGYKLNLVESSYLR